MDGRRWETPAVARDVEAAAGPGCRLVRRRRARALRRAAAAGRHRRRDHALGYDRRRFRPNLLLGGVEGFAERSWEGKLLHVGEAIIRIVDLRQRCIMTTFDPDTAAQDTEVLLRIHRELDGLLALNCEVLRPGRIRVGDTATITDRGTR